MDVGTMTNSNWVELCQCYFFFLQLKNASSFLLYMGLITPLKIGFIWG